MISSSASPREIGHPIEWFRNGCPGAIGDPGDANSRNRHNIEFGYVSMKSYWIQIYSYKGSEAVRDGWKSFVWKVMPQLVLPTHANWLGEKRMLREQAVDLLRLCRCTRVHKSMVTNVLVLMTPSLQESFFLPPRRHGEFIKAEAIFWMFHF